MAYIGNAPANRFVAPKATTRLSGNGSTTAFTLEHAVGSDEDILVSVDGVIQEPSIAYAVSNGTTLTFTAAPSSGTNNIFVCYLFRTVGTVSHPSNNALTATTGTFTGAFTSLGIDDNADATAVTIDSAERVMIGTTTEGNTSADNLTVADTGHAGITIRAGSSNSSSIYFSDATSGAAEYSGFLDYAHGTDKLSIGVNQSTKLAIDSTGAVTMEFQPAFSAKLSSAQNNIAVDTQTTVNYSTQVFDQNDDYDESTFIFTAPVTGKYQLNVDLLLQNIDAASNYYQTQLTTSNRTYYHTLDPDFGQDNQYFNLNVNVLADMDANDTAKVVIYQAGGTQQTDINSVSTFTGFLAC